MVVGYTTFDNDEIKDRESYCVPILFGIAVFSFIFVFIEKTLIMQTTNKMVNQLRIGTYEKLMKQPTEFYDKSAHSPGNLTNILASEIREVNGVAIEQYTYIIFGCTCLSVSIFAALFFNWKMCVFGFLTLPLTISCIMYASKMKLSSSAKDNKQIVEQKRMTSDTISNHSTIASLANEDYMINKYFIGTRLRIVDFVFPSFLLGLCIFW
jgi:ABC-type multidrug transport system fused ATPase/permease subunit